MAEPRPGLTAPMVAPGDAGPPDRWCLYVLRCADGTLYAGITTDLERRLAEHQAGTGARYTRGRGPLSCVGSWPYPDRSRAARAEHAFKRLSRAEKLRLLDRPQAPFEGPREGSAARCGSASAGSRP